MFNLPRDIHTRSLNTQIQWAIVLLIKVYIGVWFLVAGSAFVFERFAPNPSHYDIAWVTWVSLTGFIGGLIIGVYRFYREKKKAEQVLETLQDKIEEIKEDLVKKSKRDYLMGKSKVLHEVIPIEVRGKTYYIGVEYEPLPGVDNEKTIDAIIHDAFKDMLIKVKRANLEAQEKEE